MYPRSEYKMTQEDFDTLMEAMKPVPMIMLQCGSPPSQQENANRAWEALGKKMGFDGSTVRPVEGKGNLYFTAIPSETEGQRTERLAKEEEEKRLAEISSLAAEIEEKKKKLTELQSAQKTKETL